MNTACSISPPRVRSAGVGFLALRRLKDAVRDNDHIYATIIGNAMNNDGNAKVGYTARSLDQQAEAAAMAHSVSNVSGGSITMLEAHGIGMSMGDRRFTSTPARGAGSRAGASVEQV